MSRRRSRARRNRVESAAILRALAASLCHADEPDWPRILRLQAGARALTWANWWERRSTARVANELTRLANLPTIEGVTARC